MIDITALDKAIQNWVATFTGIETIWAEQNAPNPSCPYVTLRKSVLVPIGHDFPSDVNASTGNRRMGGIRRLTLEVNCYGPNALGILESLYMSIEYPTHRDDLLVEGLTLLDRFPVTNLTGLDDTRYQERARMEFWFLLGVETDEDIDVGVIEIVEIDETIKTYDGSILYEETLIIPET